MLSRRNIRIKVMQMLYTMSRDRELTFEVALKRYYSNVKKSFELYLFNMEYLLKIAGYALKDADRRSAKHLPTEEDKSFIPKLFQNDLIGNIRKDETYQKLVNQYHLDAMTDSDIVRKLYVEFSKTEAYKAYLEKESTNDDHRKMLLALFKHCYGHEVFNEAIEDKFSSWIDDKSLVVGTVKKTLKALPSEVRFYETFLPPDETVKEFGESLLRKVYEEEKSLLDLIEPALKNWDVDRVATIDMILIKMALCELMIFPTIPTKVTLNEFVEISKMYSTEKSKDFINGILDHLMKKLNKDGRIQKEGRGLVE